MDGIKKLKNETTRALQGIIARCRPYFDRGASATLSTADRQQYYAALFLLAERGDLLSIDWHDRDGSRPRDDRQRASQGTRRPAPRDRVKNAA